MKKILVIDEKAKHTCHMVRKLVCIFAFTLEGNEME